MSGSDAAPQASPLLALYVSTIDVRPTKGFHKTIKFIKVKKNDKSIEDVPDPQCVDGVYQIKFLKPIEFEPRDKVSVLVNCSWSSVGWKRVADIPIDINMGESKNMRRDQGMRSYRKTSGKIEVVITGHESVGAQPNDGVRHALRQLPATTSTIMQSCSRFRLLVIGNSGIGKSSLIRNMFGVGSVSVSENTRGAADIDKEFISPTNSRFVVHDSLGFEASDQENLKLVKDFVSRRKSMPHLEDQLHAIWLCVQIPYCGGRLLEDGAEEFLRRRSEILGDVPLVVVLTKVDLLDAQLGIDHPEDENYKSKYLNEHCTSPLRKVVGSDITHVIVSVDQDYSETISTLFKVTLENMAKCNVDEAPRVVASIAQRVDFRAKIDLSIIVGKKKYWKNLLRSAVFRGRTLRECLQVIHKDVVSVWNCCDPDEHLLSESVVQDLLRSDNLAPLPDTPSNMVSLAISLVSALDPMKKTLETEDITLSSAVPIAKFAFVVLQTIYTSYGEATKDVKYLMAYIVDLICVMQVIYLLTSNGRDRVIAETVNRALRVYDDVKRVVHREVEGFNGRLGVLPGGRDHVLETIEEWIWRYSIADHKIDEVRRSIRQHEGLPLGSS